MEKKSRNYSRIYIWHRFEQAEADCLQSHLSLKYKQISLKLMRNLIYVGKFTDVLPPGDVKELAKIVRDVSKKLKEKTSIY